MQSFVFLFFFCGIFVGARREMMKELVQAERLRNVENFTPRLVFMID